MNDIYKKIEEQSSNKKRKILIILFYEMSAGMLSNRKFNPAVTDLSIR